MLVLKIYVRASTAAPVELQSYSTSFVQLWYFQMGGGNQCLFLNLHLTLIFEKEKSFCTFPPVPPSLLPHQKYFFGGQTIRVPFEVCSYCFCRGLRGGFLGSLHGNPLYVVSCAGGAVPGRREGGGSGSCPSARPTPAAPVLIVAHLADSRLF